MRAALTLHPDNRCDAVRAIELVCERLSAGRLALRYIVHGDVAELLLPPPVTPSRADALWKHTCFEAFVAVEASGAYYEFNFAPSTQWAGYRFSDYRQGMQPVELGETPIIETQTLADRYELSATLDLARVADVAATSRWRLGATVVIEENNGALSYWALAHAPGKPDFHHRDGFVLNVAEAE